MVIQERVPRRLIVCRMAVRVQGGRAVMEIAKRDLGVNTIDIEQSVKRRDILTRTSLWEVTGRGHQGADLNQLLPVMFGR
jgi:hypothetical protein